MASDLPDTNQQWWQLAAIIIAGATSYPAMLIGRQLVQTMSLASVLFGIVVGNTILWTISVFLMLMSERRRLNTVQLSRSYMLRAGSAITAVAVLVSGVMWFVVQLHVASSAIVHLFGKGIAGVSVTSVRVGVVLGLITSGISLLGIRGVKWFNCIAVIPLFALIIYLFLNHPLGVTASDSRPFTFAAVAPVVANVLALSVSFPTFLRHSASRNNSIVALTLIFVFIAGFEAVGISMLSRFDAEQVWLASVHSDGALVMLPTLWLLFSACSVIAINLVNTYFSSVGWELLVPRVIGRKEYIIISLGSTLIFVLVQQHNVITLLAQISNIAIANIGAILIASYLMNRLLIRDSSHLDKVACLAVWIAAFVIGLVMEIGPPSARGAVMISTASGSFVTIVIYYVIRHMILNSPLKMDD